jgi:hypothetical protein
MTPMERDMVRSLAEIDEALGLPADGCNSTARTLAEIDRLRKLAQTGEALARAVMADQGNVRCD